MADNKGTVLAEAWRVPVLEKKVVELEAKLAEPPKVLIVPGTMRPTREEIATADIVLKIHPPSARISLMEGETIIKRFPDTFVEKDLNA